MLLALEIHQVKRSESVAPLGLYPRFEEHFGELWGIVLGQLLGYVAWVI